MTDEIDPSPEALERRTCQRQQVAFFFKRWGGARKKVTGRLLNGRTWDEYPKGSA